jgi:hypothetical protein
MGRLVYRTTALAVALMVTFSAGIDCVYACEWVGLGEIAAMVVTVPVASAIGISTALLLLALPDLFHQTDPLK